MRIILYALLSTLILAFMGCTYPQIRTNFNKSGSYQKNNRLGIISDNPLADAIASELLQYNFIIVERSRIMAIIEELKLSMTGILMEENLKKLGKILSVDAIVFVNATNEQDFPSKIGSASVKIVDVESGVLLGGVNYQNGRGGAPGSPADSGMKESLPKTAQKIAREIAKGFGK